MGLDLRWPIGWMFSLIGAMLAITGLASGSKAEMRSLGINIDLWWGLVLLVFGLFMLFMAWRGSKSAGASQTKSEDSKVNQPPPSS